MPTILEKRTLPRREVPRIDSLLEKLPFSKLPNNDTVLRRLFFELEKSKRASIIAEAAVTVKNKLIEL